MKNDKNVLRWGLFLILVLLVSPLHLSAQRQSLDDRILEKLDIEEGMTVADIGAGNGEFSVNVSLGYKVENGQIVGRVKDLMVAGSIFELFADVAGVGDTLGEQYTAFGTFKAPPILFGSLKVSAG